MPKKKFTPLFTESELEQLASIHIMSSPDDLDAFDVTQRRLTDMMDRDPEFLDRMLTTANGLFSSIIGAARGMIPINGWQRMAFEAHLQAQKPDAPKVLKLSAMQLWMFVEFLQKLHVTTMNGLEGVSVEELRGEEVIEFEP